MLLIKSNNIKVLNFFGKRLHTPTKRGEGEAPEQVFSTFLQFFLPFLLKTEVNSSDRTEPIGHVIQI